MRPFSLRWLAVPALALTLTAGPEASGQDKPGKADLPAGFKAFQPDEGIGRVLVAHVKEVASARKVLQRSLDALAGYFDGRPQILGAVGDRDDREVQALFQAKQGGRMVAGVAVVHLGAQDGVVGLSYDRPENLPKSQKALGRLLARHLPQAPAALSPLRQTQLPDGTGTLRIPEGWNLTGVKGMVDASGPQGSVHLGLWFPVNTPEQSAALRRLGVQVEPGTPYLEPAEAGIWLGKRFAAINGTRVLWTRVVAQVPVKGLQGKAAFVHYQSECRLKDGKTARVQSLAFLNTFGLADGRWVCYVSCALAPSETFAKNLPLLMEVWQSWKTDDKVFAQRLQDAARSMREIGRILQDVNAYRQHVMARAADDWSEVIRGTQILRDNQSGRLVEVPTQWLNGVLHGLNRPGDQRWSVVPLKDLNNP